MYHYAKPQEIWDEQFEQIEKEFQYKTASDKIEFALDHFEDQVQNILSEDLQERFPDKIITSEDFEDLWMLEPEKAWDILERSHLYDKIIGKYFQESL